MTELRNIDFHNLESTIWIANKVLNVPTYDFQFEPIFKTNRPRIQNDVIVTGRIGAIDDYENVYNKLLNYGYKLINNPNQHQLASELEFWYPILKEFTPKSKVYETFPSIEEFLEDFKFPIFIKGNRQTAKHNPELSVAKSINDFQRISIAYQNDPILNWQKIVIREFIELKPLKVSAIDKVQISFEFRTFWWKQELVGAGHYWSQYLDYDWTTDQKQEAINLAKNAVQLLDVPFLVIDLALTAENQWIIIECNDAQESGYCGINPLSLWKEIVKIEKQNLH